MLVISSSASRLGTRDPLLTAYVVCGIHLPVHGRTHIGSKLWCVFLMLDLMFTIMLLVKRPNHMFRSPTRNTDSLSPSVTIMSSANNALVCTWLASCLMEDRPIKYSSRELKPYIRGVILVTFHLLKVVEFRKLGVANYHNIVDSTSFTETPIWMSCVEHDTKVS